MLRPLSTLRPLPSRVPGPGARAATVLAGMLVVLGCRAAGGGAAEAAVAPGTCRNVLFLAVDDLRPELGCYGADGVETPHIDRFAAGAALFRNHFVCAPSCGPSRAALLTGRTPASSGALANEALYAGPTRLPAGETRGARTLPEVFRRAGHRTVCIGKISHTPDGRVFAYDGSGDGAPELPGAWDELATPFGPWGRGWAAFFAYPGGASREDGTTEARLVDFTAEDDGALPDGLLADAACARLAELGASGEPFFLGVGFYKPHLPWVAPRFDHAAARGTSATAGPAGPREQSPYLHGSGEFRRYAAPWGEGLPTAEDDVAAARRAYLACVRYTDRQVGRVLEALEQAGLADSTVVVLWSDHGFHLGESGVWGKHTLLDRSLWSPLLVRAPGVSRPGPREGLASAVDVFPTLVELCGLGDVPTEHPLDGVSLGPMLSDASATVRSRCLSWWGQAVSVRTAETRLFARWREGAWSDLRLVDARRGPDPLGAELVTAVDAGDPLVRSLLQGVEPVASARR